MGTKEPHYRGLGAPGNKYYTVIVQKDNHTTNLIHMDQQLFNAQIK